VRLMERAGASAIQLEDQTFPKRCGHLRDKTVIPAEEMASKIKAAVDARHSDETLIIARTDTVAVEGFERAMERAHKFVESGADVLFIEAPRSEAQLAAIVRAFPDAPPLMANMVEGGDTPMLSAGRLEALGFSLVIFPGGIVRAIAKAAQAFYATLSRDGATDAFREQMFESLRLQSDHRRGARRLSRPLSSRNRRHARAGIYGPADLRRLYGFRGEGGDRQGFTR
jgi:2-methylisocitrate lyase-like PEP mutase family enzyme